MPACPQEDDELSERSARFPRAWVLTATRTLDAWTRPPPQTSETSEAQSPLEITDHAWSCTMGSYLSKLGLSPQSPARARTDLERPAHRGPARPLYQVHRIQHVHRAQPARRHRLARRPPNWDPTNPSSFFNEAWRRFPMKRPQNSIIGTLPSDWWESYLKRNIWSLRHPRAIWSPVTVKISPPEQRVRPSFTAAVVIKSSGPSEEKPPDPCAKGTVLRALGQSRKERVNLEGSLFPKSLDFKTVTPEARQSAFKPLIKNTAIVTFVPRPGPLKRGHHSQSSDHSLKRPSGYSVASVGSIYTRGPRSTKRNVISSSYSSHSDLSEPWGRRLTRASSVQTPEWPLKKRRESLHPHSPVLKAPDLESSGTSGSSGEVNQRTPQLLASPGDLLSKMAPLRCGYAVTGEDPTLEKQAELLWNSQGKEDTGMTSTDSIAEARPGMQPPLSFISSSGTAPTTGTHPLLGSLKKMLESPGPRKTPPSTGGDTRVDHSPLERPILLAPLQCSQPEPLPSTASLFKPTAASILLAPSSPTPSVTDPIQLPTSPETDRSATPLQSAPTTKSSRHLPASVPPAGTSAHPMLQPPWGPQQTSEVGGTLHSRIPVTDAVSSISSLSTAPGIMTPTFTPIFGSMGPFRTMPMVAPIPARQPPFPLIPVSPHTFQGLAKSTSVVIPTVPTNTSKDSVFKPSLDLSIVKVTNTTGNTCSVPSSCHSFLSVPATGFISRPPQHPTIPNVHTVTIFNQVLMSATQISPLKSTANLKAVDPPLPVSGLAPRNQPEVAPSTSNLTPTFTTPGGSGSSPTFPPSLGGISQPTSRAMDGQKPCPFQPALAPSISSSFILKNSVSSAAPRPVPAQPVLGRTTQPDLGGLTSSAPTFLVPTGIQPGFSNTPTTFPCGEASPAGLEVAKQSHQSGVCDSVFGITAPRPFAFGGLVTPMDCEEPESTVAVPQVVTSGAVLSGTTRTLTPFAQGWSQHTPSQSTPLALGRASLTIKKTLCGVPSAPIIRVSGSLKAGSSVVGFGMPFPSAQGSTGKEPSKSWAPLFSIGAKSKSLRTREHVHSRRHHPCKK